MYNHLGFVAECTADNLFLVSNGTLQTPPLHAGRWKASRGGR